MQTYAEEQGKQPFDWNAFLNKKDFTEEELIIAEDLSASYVTCACGVQCSIIPRMPDGTPTDRILEKLGSDFYGCILNMNYRDQEDDPELFKESHHSAKENLKRIEIRSTQLLHELNKSTDQ